MNPKGFTKLASEHIHQTGVPVTTVARRVQIAPRTLQEMVHGGFAQTDYHAMLPDPAKSSKGRLKKLHGSFISLKRLCAYFGLDLESFAMACGFPRECLHFTEPGLRSVSLELVPTIEELVKVHQIIDLTGPISLREIGSTVMRMRENGKSP
jgi:hypothetical protein